jgi:homoserine acetyltransferase
MSACEIYDLGDVVLQCGITLRQAKLAFKTYGALNAARDNVMPTETDLYFRLRDNEMEVAQMPNAELRPIPSIWGHVAAFGAYPPDNQFMHRALNELLKS